MASAELIDARAPGRPTLVGETVPALEILEALLGPASPMDAATREAIAATCTEVRRLLGRSGTNVALVGERTTNALLDALLARPVFGDVETAGEGPLIVVRSADRASCRAVLRNGRVEELELALPDRAPEPKSAIERGGWFRRLVRRMIAALRALLGRRAASLREAASGDATARVRELVDPRRRAGEVDEVWLTLPIPGMPSAITLYDLRGMMARTKDVALDFLRFRTDAAILVLDSSSRRAGAAETTRELARRLSSHGARVLVATSLATAEVARFLGVDAARVARLPPVFGAQELADKVIAEREVMIGARTSAALRLAQRGIEEAIARDEARDREAMARLESYLAVDHRRRLDETRHRVGGATAGRAIRILQSVLSLFEAEFVPLCDERMRVVSGARSIDELRVAVADTGTALGELRGKLVAQAERYLDEATSRLGPPLLEDLERRVELVLRDVGVESPGRPVWPDLPRITLEGHLVADATLTTGEALSADIGWTDSFLRSFDKVKERCMQQLAEDLERLSQAVRTEILGSEPRVAASLHDGLEAWVEDAGDRFATWLAATMRAERAARDAARAERQAPWLADRDSLLAQGKAMSARFR